MPAIRVYQYKNFSQHLRTMALVLRTTAPVLRTTALVMLTMALVLRGLNNS